MNSLETDLKRSIFSIPFMIGVIIQYIVLKVSGPNTELHRVSVPVLATFPYSTAWLMEYENGFLKACVPRAGVNAYIFGKLIACGISGGLVEVLGCEIYRMSEKVPINMKLIFLSAVMWAVLSAALAAWWKSRYVAYCGAFVIFYLMVIVCQRYYEELYCLNPYEWLNPEHTWIFGENGIAMMLSLATCLISLFYYMILRRDIRNA